MKKSLQPKKKMHLTARFAISPNLFLCPEEDRIPRNNYWDVDYLNRIAHTNFASYYYGHLTGKLSPATYQRCHRTTRIGSLLVHPESGLCKSAFKEFLKQGNARISWDKYYESILAEQISFSALAMCKEATKFGLELIFVSTTPVRYKRFVIEWLARHNLINPENPQQLVSKEVFKTKDEHFLEATFWHIADRASAGQAYFLFDSNLYPKTGWTPLSDYF
jgi:hypothetical protein